MKNKNENLTKNEKISKSMECNNNAEVWTADKAESFFNEAIELSNQKEIIYLKIGEKAIEAEGYKYDFIGEIARELDSYIDIFDYLIGKFPNLSKKKNKIMRNCEANCFSNAKKGNIKEASAIMNLKSNHKWTDRHDNTSSDGTMSPTKVSKEEAKEISDSLENEC